MTDQREASAPIQALSELRPKLKFYRVVYENEGLIQATFQNTTSSVPVCIQLFNMIPLQNVSFRSPYCTNCGTSGEKHLKSALFATFKLYLSVQYNMFEREAFQ